MQAWASGDPVVLMASSLLCKPSTMSGDNWCALNPQPKTISPDHEGLGPEPYSLNHVPGADLRSAPSRAFQDAKFGEFLVPCLGSTITIHAPLQKQVLSFPKLGL